jgi:hypothetical protein
VKQAELTYANMVVKLPEALPELRARYDEEVSWLTTEDSSYTMYSFVLYQHIADLIKNHQDRKVEVRNAFDFLELLLTHPEYDVRDVAAQSVIENICEDEIVLRRASKHMGPAATKACASYLSYKKPIE